MSARLLRPLLTLALVVLAVRADAATITLQWDRNTEPDVTSYTVSYGTRSGVYDTRVNVGNVTTYTLTLSPAVTTTYYFIVTATSPGGESDPSAEASTVVGGPVPAGDFDGDARADLTLYSPTGDWTIRTSSSNYVSTLAKSWGGPGYTVVPGDYDGDGKQDFAVYRAATADWFILKSNAGYTTSFSASWGGPGYIPVPGDYDGDKRTDIAVYSVTTGAWYVLTSSSNYTSSLTINWGGPGYTPVPGLDFDGDGKADATVYTESTGAWNVLL